MDTLGVRVIVQADNGEHLGAATVPTPVELGDVFALEQGPPLRIVAVMELEGGDIGVQAERIRLAITG